MFSIIFMVTSLKFLESTFLLFARLGEVLMELFGKKNLFVGFRNFVALL